MQAVVERNSEKKSPYIKLQYQGKIIRKEMETTISFLSKLFTRSQFYAVCIAIIYDQMVWDLDKYSWY